MVAVSIFLGLQIAIGVFLLLLSGYALYLRLLYLRHRGPDPEPRERFDEAALPRVTIQLPVRNEGPIIERLLRSAAALDYPRDRLQIQYIDDSDDETTAIALRTIAALRTEQPDLEIEYRKRPTRAHFKAGALQFGLQTASGELVGVFDADFIVAKDFLRRTVDFFKDPEIGMVQARWSHLNHGESLLTRVQAKKIDAHQMFEQTARNRSGRWVQFHGTAGIWRRKTLDRAGGWNCLTETEDIEVSIRALLQGCRVIYLDRLRLPSELPSSMRHYLRQQMRWKRGWTRVARHYSAPIWRSRAPVLQRADLLQRLYNSFGTALALPFTVAALPTFLVAERLDVWLLPFVLYSGLLLTSLANRFFEERLLREDSRRLATGVGPERRSRIAWNRALSLLPTGFILDLGTMWPLTQATFEGFVREPGWEVTPKGGQVSGGAAREAATGPRLPRYAVGTVMVLFVSFALLIVSLRFGHWVAGLFYLLLVIGSGWVGGMLIAEGKGIGVTPPSLAASPSSPPRLTTQPPTTPK